MYNKLVNEKRIIANIPIEEIDPYEDYPFIIDERELFNLALSIKKNGLLVPGAVRKNGDRYELLSRHKRLAPLSYVHAPHLRKNRRKQVV